MQIDLFEWVSGNQLGSVEDGVTDAASVERDYVTIGSLAAQVHEQSSAWTVPPGFVRHSWDAEGLAGEQPLWGRYWDLDAATPAERDLLVRVRDRMYDDLRQLDQSTNAYSMIHADFAPENLLVEGDHVRLIDFDDAGWGWHLFELATSLYFIMDQPYFEQAKDALLKGYRLHRTLTDEQLDLLPLFFVARGTTYLGWVHTRPNTETARDRTPVLLDQARGLAEAYLSG